MSGKKEEMLCVGYMYILIYLYDTCQTVDEEAETKGNQVLYPSSETLCNINTMMIVHTFWEPIITRNLGE